MPETYEEAKSPTSAPNAGGGDKVGDILRKERLTRRITIETIAKDLKLNVGYIKALEASDYDALPVDPYVRVYIKSLAKYLSLDAESVMKQFYRERGLIIDEKNTANKIDISVQKHEKNPTVVIAAVLIVILAVFAFIANQKGWLTQDHDIGANGSAQTTDTLITNTGDDLDSAGERTIDALAAPQDTGTASKAPPRP